MLKLQPFATPFAAMNATRAVHTAFQQSLLNQRVTAFTATLLSAAQGVGCLAWLQALPDVNACASCCIVQQQEQQ